MRHIIWVALLAVGCGESGELAALKASLRVSEETVAKSTQAVEVKQDEAIVILKDNTASLTAIKTKIESLEASLAKSEPQNGKDGDPASAPNPPAKANTQQAPLKVATPGDFSRIASDGTRLKWDVQGNWNPTILETSAHLREHGIDTNGMTHQEMADIHAGIHEGKQMPVSAVRVKNASPVSNCPGGTCPTNRTQRRRGLFGGLFR